MRKGSIPFLGLTIRLWSASCTMPSQRGVTVVPGYRAEEFRLDLAFVNDGIKLDIECDGAAFHRERRTDRIRDARLTGAGWTVMRFDGREIIGNVRACVGKVLAIVDGSTKGEASGT